MNEYVWYLYLSTLFSRHFHRLCSRYLYLIFCGPLRCSKSPIHDETIGLGVFSNLQVIVKVCGPSSKKPPTYNFDGPVGVPSSALHLPTRPQFACICILISSIPFAESEHLRMTFDSGEGVLKDTE